MNKPIVVNGVDFSDLMTGREVARLFQVSTQTVARWAQAGWLASIRTPGGARRYSRTQVMALLTGSVSGTSANGQTGGTQ